VKKPHTFPRRAGLTLIEVLIVIAILLAIAGLVVVNLMPTRDRADIDLTRVQIKNIGAALDQFRLDMRRYPTEDEGLRVLWSRDAMEDDDDRAKWRAYLTDPLPRDAWGTEWIYRNPSEERGEGFYDLISAGPDRQEGTDDDITNHDHLRGEDGSIEGGADGFRP
jgi:general secretion pathway protein G